VLEKPNLRDGDATAKADIHIRARLALARPGDIQLTVSAGVAAASGDDVSYDALFRAADLALLEAKREGRNRVVAAGVPHAVVAA
jgi:two-component system cell cycle response regulator